MAYQSNMVEQQEIAPVGDSVDESTGATITRHQDGTMTVAAADAALKPRIPLKGNWDENLAGVVRSVKHLADRLIDFAAVDLESRKDWEEREKRSLEMLGIKDTIPAEDQKAPGLNSMTHPMLMEAVVRFQSNAITEIFPATGPAKSKILGTQTAAKKAQAERIEMFVNYYLTEVDREYFADTDQMLMYLPIAGSVFRKAGQNWVTGMPELRYVKATSFIAPYAGTDLKSMPRYAHQYTMTGGDIERAMASGMFLDQRLPKSNLDAMHDRTADTSDGRLAQMHDEDQLYVLYEYHIDLSCKDLDDPKVDADSHIQHPYIVIVERDSQMLLMVRRNWREGDERAEKKIWFAHHKYLPGLGFYGWGLCHVIGSLQNAASGAVNAVLDAAQMATFQGGFKTKEGKSLSGELRLEAGVFKDVDATYEDISKSFFVPPFKEPGPALPNLLTQLVEQGQRFAGTSDAAVGDASNMGPVGTTIALIEQSQKPQSAIHKRLHKSMSDELRMFGDLVHAFMGESYSYSIGADQQQLMREDFNGHVNVVSVTDPNIASNTQRIQQAQALDQAAQQHPDLFTPKKKAAIVMRLFEALKIADIEEVAPEADEPQYIDAVTENGLILKGKGVRVYDTQDDEAHLAIHRHGAATAAASPMDPQTQQMVMAAYGVHIRDHMASSYRKQIYALAGIQPPPEDNDGNPVELPADIEAQITAAVVAKLPPPPPPPAPPQQGPTPEQKVQAELQAKQTLAEAQAKRDDATAQMDNERKTRAFLEEEARKDAAHRAELMRIKQKTEAERRREDHKTAAGIVRESAKAGVQHRMAAEGHQQDLQHGAESHALDHVAKQRGTAIDLANKAKGAEVERTEKSKSAAADRDAKAKSAQSDRAEKARTAAQDRRIKAKGAETEQGIARAQGEQTLAQKAEEAKLRMAAAREEAKQRLRKKRDAHKHTMAANREKLAQQKAAAKAKSLSKPK
jgi:hypothetical protein